MRSTIQNHRQTAESPSTENSTSREFSSTNENLEKYEISKKADVK